jgi:PhoPQ-activated pathogenicity-related protein
VEPDGSIQVKAQTQPIAVALWQAANPVARDFRLEAIGPAYRRSALEGRDGVYIAKAPQPAQGWVAYFIELTFPSGGVCPFKFTSGVRVAPDVLPFGPPPEMASSGHENQRGGSQ